MRRTLIDWLVLAGALYLAHRVRLDVRSGVSRTWLGYSMPDRYAYTRSADPLGYWIVIAFHGALAVGTVIAFSGELLGVWNLGG